MTSKIILFFLLPIFGHAKFQFKLDILESNCFFEELPESFLVQGKYKIENWNSSLKDYSLANPALGLLVTVHGTDKKIIMKRTYTTSGRISFASSVGGEYTICVQAIKTKSHGDANVKQLRVTLNLKSSSNIFPNDGDAKQEKLNDLEVRVRRLLDQTKDIVKEQEYQRLREERFRITSENTRWHLMMWIFLQLLALATLCVWQARHLTSFFVKKKLV